MANILGKITINNILYLEVDSNPSSGGGASAPIGSHANAVNGAGEYYKFGSGNTDWSLVNAMSFIFAGARGTSSSVNRDMESDGLLLSTTEYIVPFNCELKYISASTDTAETWEAHVYKNGTSVASLTLTAVDSAVSALLSVSFSAGDKVRLRQQNGTGAIGSPRISAFFKQV